MNILIENGTYDCHNAGDLSMLKVCIDRLNKQYPDSNLLTVSESPDSLTSVINQVTPVSLLKGKVLWLQERNLFGGLHKVLPIQNSLIDSFESSIRREYRSASLRRISNRKNATELMHIKNYMDIIDSIDIAVVSGGGFITDSFENHAIKLLETIYLILKRGKAVAFFGQGIGPIKSPRLKKLAKKVFPLVTIFALRENVKGPALLKSLGVKPSNIVVTGDDAIELAATGRKQTLGNEIGFNIRIASYAAVENEVSTTLVNLLNKQAKLVNSSIIPVPISWHEHENDLKNALSLLNVESNNNYDNLESIAELIEQTSKCRIVVTGSYHAAVFALAQGIPVIAIANSEYYVDKFEGLSSMFKDGLKIIVLNQLNWEEPFINCFNQFWTNAENLREPLRIQADRQVELSRNTYQRFFSMVDQ